MKPILPCLVSLTMWFAPAHAAAPSWWSPLPFESNAYLSTEQLALIDRAAPRADLFEPLWVERSYIEQMTAAFGGPDSRASEVKSWNFTTLLVRIDESTPGTTLIQLIPQSDPSAVTVFDPSSVAFGAYVPATQSCVDAVELLGKPSSAESNERLEWTTLGRGRDAHLAVYCDDLRGLTMVTLRLTTTTPDQLIRIQRSIPPAQLPKAFVPASPTSPADPRPLWPAALMPGQPLSAVVATLGPPGWVVRDATTRTDHLHYGDGMRIDGDFGGRVVAVEISSHAAELQKRFDFKSPIVGSVGKPSALLTKLIGPPIESPSHLRHWFWDGQGHELSLDMTEADGQVTKLALSWQPPVEPRSLLCRQELEAAPSSPPPASTYRAPDSGRELSSTQLVPFGLWFGANVRDVVDRLGLPRRCGPTTMAYRGLDLSFDDDVLIAVALEPAILVPELRALRDPLVAMLTSGGPALLERFGPGGGARLALFERGDEHITVGLVGPPASRYMVRFARGFGYDGIAGIDLLQLPASAEALAVAGTTVTHDNQGVASMEIPIAAKQALAGRVSGRFFDLLGAPWTTLLTALGEPDGTIMWKQAELHITWRWPDDPYGRSVVYRCTGTTPTCTTLIVGTRRSTLEEEP